MRYPGRSKYVQPPAARKLRESLLSSGEGRRGVSFVDPASMTADFGVPTSRPVHRRFRPSLRGRFTSESGPTWYRYSAAPVRWIRRTRTTLLGSSTRGEPRRSSRAPPFPVKVMASLWDSLRRPAPIGREIVSRACDTLSCEVTESYSSREPNRLRKAAEPRRRRRRFAARDEGEEDRCQRVRRSPTVDGAGAANVSYVVASSYMFSEW